MNEGGLDVLDGVRMLWHDDWYDGPVSGMAEWGGDEFWFVTLNEEWPTERPRQFRLIRIPAPMIFDEWAEHRELERLVGTQYCEHLPADQR